MEENVSFGWAADGLGERVPLVPGSTALGQCVREPSQDRALVVNGPELKVETTTSSHSLETPGPINPNRQGALRTI